MDAPKTASRTRRWPCLRLLLAGVFLLPVGALGGEPALTTGPAFPLPLSAYGTSGGMPLLQELSERFRLEPFNIVATAIFFLAIVHTFLAPVFARLAGRFDYEHQRRLASRAAAGQAPAGSAGRQEVSFKAKMFHFLGEVEAVFGIWIVPLLIALSFAKGWPVARDYIGYGVNFTEPVFVVVIMTIAASRPILECTERILALFARLGARSPAAWWLSILTVGPLLGSFITEPAAMTISALLLAEKFYRHQPRRAFAYATLGLLFVNVSVGGTLTHFAAPPVLMVAGKWGWGAAYMLEHFGWKAAVGIAIANVVYLLWFRRDFNKLGGTPMAKPIEPSAPQVRPVPAWIVGVHILFLAWTVLNNHFPVLFVGGFLFYLAFTHATEHYQEDLALRPALLVGFFLAGLVVHGSLQAWWIEPVLKRLAELPLFFAATGLTAFNDNAAITYLASLVPGFNDALKQAVVEGAVVGGGLTVIANAPNPAGQSILGKYFPDGVSPLWLFLGAALPTIIVGACFLVFR